MRLGRLHVVHDPVGCCLSKKPGEVFDGGRGRVRAALVLLATCNKNLGL